MTTGARPGWLKRLKPDTYILLIVGMVVLASVLPAQGMAAPIVSTATKLGIGLLFFLHGARLSRSAVLKGILHWRLHLVVLGSTFVLFPLLCIGMTRLPAWIIPAGLVPGLIYLGCLPSTIQSSIGFTSIARGNVAATVAAATASNLLGMFLTPIMAGILLQTQGGGISLHGLESIGLQLLAPFLAGQVLHQWIGPWVIRNGKMLALVDRGSILLVVYSAFSQAVVSGFWQRTGAPELLQLLLICGTLLVLVLLATVTAARSLGFSKEDEITIVFCGSKKSLASGVPMASVLFPGASLGMMLLPIMIFHQIQLMACTLIAQRYAERSQTGADAAGSTV